MKNRDFAMIAAILLCLGPGSSFAGGTGFADARLSREQVRQAQVELNKRTAVSVTEDGRLGAETTAAVRQFQVEQGLIVTGSLDKATLQALGVRDPFLERSPASVDRNAPKGPY